MKKYGIFISEELFNKWRQAMADNMERHVETISDTNVVNDLEHWMEHCLFDAVDALT